MRGVIVMFVAVFLAELGDKTQIATMMFAAKRDVSPWVVFLAASAALVASSALAVLLGRVMGDALRSFPIKLIAGLVFVGLGVLYIVEHFKEA